MAQLFLLTSLLSFPILAAGFQAQRSGDNNRFGTRSHQLVSFRHRHQQQRDSIHRRHDRYAGVGVRGKQEGPMARTTACGASFASIDGAGSAIDTFFQTQPYLSAFLTCSFKASAADFVAQSKEEEESSPAAPAAQGSGSTVDISRNLAFIVYGGTYQGLFQEALYSKVFPQIFPGRDWQTIAMQVGFDMFVIGPLLCLPLAYFFKAIFIRDKNNTEGEDYSPLSLESLRVGLEKYVDDIVERNLLLTFWALWVPVKTLTFTIIPTHYRIAFIALVSFFWMFILSSVSASTTPSPSSSPAATLDSISSASRNTEPAVTTTTRTTGAYESQ